MTNSLNTVLAALTLAQLVETFNNLSTIVDSVEVKKFSSKDNGVGRTIKMLDRVNEYRHEEKLPLIGIAADGKLFNIEPEPVVPAKKAAPAAPKAAKKQGKAPGRTAAVSPSDVIIVLVAAGTNPKQAKAAERFAHYATGIKVADYVEALGGDRKQALRDINWDTKQNWIQVVGPKSAAAKASQQEKPATTEQAAPAEQLALPAPAALLMIAGPVAASLTA